MDFDNEAERQAIRDLVATLYRSISGPGGSPRAWDALAGCFVPDGRLTPFQERPDGELAFDVFTPATYAASRKALLEGKAFHEAEVGHEATISGRLAHVFSRYEARREPDGPPVASGVNSIQLVRTPAGWRILSIAWQFTGG